MSLSLLIRKVAGAWVALACVAPALTLAQSTAYFTNGSEYAIVGALPGDQTFAQASLAAQGGFLVWEDNGADGKGLGILGVGLDSNLQAVQSPFRVNQVTEGDQEKPRVALLAYGGAAFVWQGGKQGLQHIYARFLTASNTWQGGDVLVSTPTNRFQRQPAITALRDGNAAVVWASYNQAATNSLFDVYGQILSPAGAKVGAQFRVNQAIALNQRNPAIATLQDGGFVVVWVSEGTTNETSILARRYTSYGAAITGEFQINTTTNLCAEPAVTALADGGFLVAWGQKNVLDVTNTWDIVARAFNPDGVGGVERTVNTRLRGRQISPQVAAIGSDVLAVWASEWQDGSDYGIYGRYLRSDGLPVGGEFRVNTTTIGTQVQPAVAADGVNRFLAVWSTYRPLPFAMDLGAQMYAPADYLPVAAVTNYVGPATVEEPVVPGSGSEIPILAFPESDFSGDPWVNGYDLAQGYYHGLFYETNGVTLGRAGSFAFVVNRRGVFSARITLGAQSYPFSGQFDAAGRFTKVVPGTGGKLMADLRLNLTGGNQVGGVLTHPAWSAQLLANKVVYSVYNPCKLEGTYGMVIPPADPPGAGPAGASIGVVKVSSLGTVLWVANLADGGKVSQSTRLSEDGIWPLHAAPYSGRGLNLGWIEISNDGLSGDMVWMRPARIPSRYYSSGFTNQVEVLGSAYARPAPGQRVLNWPSAMGQLVFKNGGFSAPWTKGLFLDANHRVFGLDGRAMNVTISLLSGFISGTVPHPVTGKPLSFQGMLLQNQGMGAGFFTTGTDVGEVELKPAAQP